MLFLDASATGDRWRAAASDSCSAGTPLTSNRRSPGTSPATAAGLPGATYATATPPASGARATASPLENTCGTRTEQRARQRERWREPQREQRHEHGTSAGPSKPQKGKPQKGKPQKGKSEKGTVTSGRPHGGCNADGSIYAPQSSPSTHPVHLSGPSAAPQRLGKALQIKRSPCAPHTPHTPHFHIHLAPELRRKRVGVSVADDAREGVVERLEHRVGDGVHFGRSGRGER
eukprot:366129-Chlamydomonas_euryale.AAC.1